MKQKLLFGAFLFALSAVMVAQETFAPTKITNGTFLGKTVPMRDFATTTADNLGSKELKVVPNRYEGIVLGEEQYVNRSEASRQYKQGTYKNSAIGVDFLGASSGESGFLPPDPTGAVGPNHYLHAVNSLVKIFDKTGNLLVGPVSLGNFIGNGDNFGDPIAMYDQLADRFFISQFGSATNSLVLAVSESPDPAGAYNVYEFTFSAFPDYPHYSVWPDGYYLTVNEGGGGGGANPRDAYVIERDVVLAGGANPQMAAFELTGQFSNPTTVFMGASANLLGTNFPADTPGFFTYLQDDSWSNSITFDHLKVWEVDIDWDNINNSTISAPNEIPLDSFDSLFAPFGVGDIDQPGTSQALAGQGGLISYAANYRTFGDHNSWVITFNVDVDGNDTSGIRWIELRNTAADPTWSVFQEGTYAPEDGLSRFMSAAAMDAQGNIGLAYNIAGPTLATGIRHTGRFSDDPAGEMTIAEVNILDAPGVQTNSNRFGDYSHTTMDPDNFTFWHTTQYFPSNNNWASRITSYTLSSGFAIDGGTNSIVAPNDGTLTGLTPVEVVVRNFGSDDLTDIPVELSVDGVMVASEVVPGTLSGGASVNYTFAQEVDLSTEGQSYDITVRTNIAGDQFAVNDEVTKTVTHLFANDIGVAAIISPVSGESLSNAESVTVTLENFGGADQSNFDVTFDLDGATTTETVAGPLPAAATLEYTFTQTVDLSAFQTYNLSVSTSLPGDADPSNDSVSATINNSFCQPTADCSFGDGFQLFELADISNTSGCEGYADFTKLTTELAQGESYNLTVTTGYGDQFVNVWIDFNDNAQFEPEELIIDNFEIADGQASGSFTEVIDFVVPEGATLGQHIMRAKTNWNAPVPADACEETQFGETEDYTAIIIETLSIEDRLIADGELVVSTLDNNIFDVQLNTAYDGRVYISVYNTLGQQLKYKLVATRDTGYGLTLDMSEMSTGVYLVRLGSLDTKSSKTAKIIVQ